MQMRPSRTPSRANQRDGLALFHQIAHFYLNSRSMRIQRIKPVAIADFDHLSVSRLVSRLDDNPAGGRLDGGALGRGQINPVVHGVAPGHRIAAPAKGRAEVGVLYEIGRPSFWERWCQ